MTYNAVAAATSLALEVARRANEIEAGRRMPADLARKFADAGLFRMLLPATLDGHETAPSDVAHDRSSWNSFVRRTSSRRSGAGA